MHMLKYPTGDECVGCSLNGSTVTAVTFEGAYGFDGSNPVIPDTTYRLTLADGSVCFRTGRQLATWFHDVSGACEGCCSYVDDDTEVRCTSPATFDIDCEPNVPLDGKVRSCDAHLVTVLNECKKAVVHVRP